MHRSVRSCFLLGGESLSYQQVQVNCKQELPGKGKKGFSSCGDNLFGGGLVGIFFAKPLTGDFSAVSCCIGFVTLKVDFLKLFHKPENIIIK